MGAGRVANGLTYAVVPTIWRSGVEWVACYESAIEGDARTVLALLEGRGIPCRLEPMGSSMFPSMGFAVLVPADQLEAAQELLESEAPEPTPTDTVEPEPVSPDPILATNEMRVMDLVRRALRIVAAHPTLLLTAVVGIVSNLALEAIDDPNAPVLDTVREHFGTLVLVLVLGTATQGLAVAFADGVLDGRPSWSEAVRRTIERLSRLLVSGIVVGTPSLIPVAFGSQPPAGRSPLSVFLVPALCVYAYVLFRLSLVPMALIVDRAGIPDAFRRSWEVMGRGWPQILGLIVLGLLVSTAFGFVLGMSFVIGPLVSAVTTVAWVLAYRMLTGRPTASSGTR